MKKSIVFTALLLSCGIAMADKQPITPDVTLLLAQQGHSKAQYMMGHYYSEGIGVNQDLKKAFEWYQLSAQQGYRDAQFNLATAYDTGEGVKQDLVQAAFWYEQAAMQGEGAAAYNLAIMFDEGAGVKADKVKAATWMNLAQLLQYDLADQAWQEMGLLLSKEVRNKADSDSKALFAKIPTQ